MATIAADGTVTALADGSTTLLASRGKVLAATVLNVGDPNTPSNEPTLGVFPQVVSVAVGGAQQLVVGEPGKDLTAGTTGTVYYTSDPDVITVSADGLVSGVGAGAATVTVIGDGQEVVVAAQAFAPTAGATTAGLYGGVVVGGDGSTVVVPEESLVATVTVTITPLAVDDLPYALPDPFQYVAGFHLDVGATPLANSAQVSVPAAQGFAAGTPVMFFQAGYVPDATGTQQPTWLEVGPGVVTANGFAQFNNSPLWQGIHSTGDYLVAYGDPSLVGLVQGTINLTTPVDQSNISSFMLYAPPTATGQSATPVGQAQAAGGGGFAAGVGLTVLLGQRPAPVALIGLGGILLSPLLLLAYARIPLVQIHLRQTDRPAGRHQRRRADQRQGRGHFPDDH